MIPTGGISQVQVQGVNLNLGAQAREIVGVQQDDVCTGIKCYNGGTCRPYNIRQGYMCVCPPGYGGHRCDREEERCRPGKCSSKIDHNISLIIFFSFKRHDALVVC